jgi:hypothetical protein
MRWTESQRATHYAYYHARAIDLLHQVEAPDLQRTDLDRIIQVATRLCQACPFRALNHFYQTIIHQATAIVTRTPVAPGTSALPKGGDGRIMADRGMRSRGAKPQTARQRGPLVGEKREEKV